MYPSQASAPPYPPSQGVPQYPQKGVPAEIGMPQYPQKGVPVPEYPQEGIPLYPQVGIPQYPQHHHAGNSSSQAEWSTGLCGCCEDAGNCCLTCCCPCITFGQIAEVIDKGETSCTLAGLIYYALTCVACQCIYSCGYRSKLRSLYGIKEGSCGDFLIHCCCDACAICQEYRELKIRGVDPSIGWHGNVAKWNREGSMMPPAFATGMNR